MKKIVRLTESDLVRLVKRVIREQSKPECFQNLNDLFEKEIDKVYGTPDANGRRKTDSGYVPTAQDLKAIDQTYRPNFISACKAFEQFLVERPDITMNPQQIPSHPKGRACLNGFAMSVGGREWNSLGPNSAETKMNLDAVTRFAGCVRNNTTIKP